MSLRPPVLSTLLALGLASSAGCSALGLDHIPIPSCASSDDCASLNRDANLAESECERYFCRASRCVLGPEDYDGDTFAKCGDGAIDCDDRHATAFPGASETACNGVDDDCNGVVDDGAFATGPSVVVPTLGTADHVSFAQGAEGVSAVAWATTDTASAALLGTGAGGAASELSYETNVAEGITRPTTLTTAPGCMQRGSAGVACPTSGATCNGPGMTSTMHRLPWLDDLPGDGHFCSAGTCDACTADTDCMPNTLPRTCNVTAGARACGPAGTAMSSPANCCAGQVLETGTTPATGSDPAACCPSMSRVCAAGVCRDACRTDADCPLVHFTQSLFQPVFGVCVAGVCLPPTRPDVQGPDGRACNFDDVALDRSIDATAWLVASISTRGCASGLLRLGVSTTDQPMDVLALGPESRSDVFTGVDVDATLGGTACTGASRADATRGATQPSVAALRTGDTTNGTALVTFLARPAMGLPACAAGSTAYDVEALGAWFAGPTMTDAAFVHASDDGVPRVLGQTVGVGRPAVAAIDGHGWIVGFGSPGTASSVQLRFVGALDPLPELTPACASGSCADGGECINGRCLLPCSTQAECGTDALECCLSSACPAAEMNHCRPSARGHVARLSSPLSPRGPGGTIASGAAADHVRIAVGRVQGATVAMGVVWQEGCDATARVHFARATLDATTGAITSGTSLEIGRGSMPVVGYLDEGVLVPGRPGPGGFVPDATTAGGYVVTWSSDGQLLAVRVDETGTRVVDATPQRLDDAARAVGPREATVFASAAAGTRLEYAYAEAGASPAVLGGGLSCRAMMP